MKKIIPFLLLTLTLTLSVVADTITLTWPAAPANQFVTSYKVYVSTNGATAAVHGTTTNATYSAVFSVPAIYQFSVSAVNLAGEGQRSASVAGPSLPTAPGPVTLAIEP